MPNICLLPAQNKRIVTLPNIFSIRRLLLAVKTFFYIVTLQFRKAMPSKKHIMTHRRQLALAAMPPIAIILYILCILFGIQTKSLLLPSSHSNITTNSSSKFRLLIGILTRADKYDSRHFLRMVYGIQSSPLAEIDVKFVMCRLTKTEQRVLISLEIMRFGDVIILNCTENMNSGKTYSYLSSLPKILPRRYDYVMKADDDVYLRFVPLASSLEPLPRVDLYYGFVIPCSSMNPFVDYMSGMGFLLSWDLVEWISISEIPKNHTFGPEDMLVGRWLKMGNKAKNRVSNKPRMYDYPGTNSKCSHDLIPDTLAVHRLKRWDQWLHVLNYFNVTKQVKQSKMYTIHN